ncbi:Uncharacterised protein [Serratia ficaria]|nr:Uncharacterised protein [Serratia ficaria]
MSRSVEVVIQLFPTVGIELRVLLQQAAEQHQTMTQPFCLLGR